MHGNRAVRVSRHDPSGGPHAAVLELQLDDGHVDSRHALRRARTRRIRCQAAAPSAGLMRAALSHVNVVLASAILAANRCWQTTRRRRSDRVQKPARTSRRPDSTTAPLRDRGACGSRWRCQLFFERNVCEWESRAREHAVMQRRLPKRVERVVGFRPFRLLVPIVAPVGADQFLPGRLLQRRQKREQSRLPTVRDRAARSAAASAMAVPSKAHASPHVSRKCASLRCQWQRRAVSS